MNEYKPYQEEWEREVDLKEFIVWLTFQLATFENNMRNLPLTPTVKTKDEWMDMFLLWSEYATDYSKL